MAKSTTSPIDKAARLLDLVPYISTHQGIALTDLASDFGIKEDELLDDLNTLWMCGLPGYTPLELIDLSFDSGYVSIRNAEVLQRVRLLTKDELVVMAIGLDLLKGAILAERGDLISSIASLQIKIKNLIGDIASAAPTVDSAFRAMILKGIRERNDLELNYHSLIRDEISDRRVTPIELSEENGIEILFSYCHKAKAFRSFRLDNIKGVRICAKSDPVVRDLAQSDSQFTATCNIRSRHRTTLERFRLDPSSALFSDISKEIDREIQVSSFSQDWLLRNFLSTLGCALLLGPDELRSQVGQRSASALALYASGAFLPMGGN